MSETVYVSSGGNFPVVYFLIMSLISIASYIFVGFCLMKMADRLGVENSWFAFVPILNIWLLCQMDDKPVSWFVLMLVGAFCTFGLLTIILGVLIFMDVAEKLGFENWWGILIIIPIFNYYVMYKLAFTEA